MQSLQWLIAAIILAGILTAAVLLPQQAPAVAAPAGGAASATTPEYQTWPGPGIYVFLDWSNMDPAQYPYITGSHEIVTWSGVEGKAEGQYDWSWLDDWIANNAALGKPVALGFNSYDGQCCSPPDGHWLPQWYLQRYPDGYVVCQDGVVLPKYWSQAYLNAFGDFIRAAAARYDDDPRVAWVEISHGIYGETTPAENEFDACLVDAGLTSELWVQTVNAITDIYRTAWQHKPLLIQYAPFFLDRAERREFTDYAGALGVGMKHNKLLVDHDDQVIDDPDYRYYRAGQYDPMFTFAGQVPMAWEVYRLYFKNPGDTLWGFLNGLDKHPTYFLVTRSLLMTQDPLEQEVLAFASRYAGRTLEDTPGVWVALRETRSSWYPQRGNFEFWLYQNDDVPGGRTVPLWDVTAYPQGRYTRRTDEASGNPYMYFDIDNGYLFATTEPVTITITYLDQGYDAWELHYDGWQDDFQLAGRVEKTNTGRWLTKHFGLSDAEFADGMPGGGEYAGSDFRIWSGGDGDEFIHFVKVEKATRLPGEGTPTPTPIANPTPTPTPTPSTPAVPMLAAPYRQQPPTIDGDLSDWPPGDSWYLDRYTASYVHPRSLPEPADASAQLRVAWDEHTLYVAVIITDSQQVADSVDVWRDDSLELGVDAAHDHVAGGPDDHQFTATVDGRLTDFGINSMPAALIAVQRQATRWTVELALPLSTLEVQTLMGNQTLGLTLGLHDDDDGGDWDSYLILAGTTTQSSSSDWGDVILLPSSTTIVRGRTWYDVNANGLHEPAENAPIPGVNIAVLDEQGAILATAASDNQGFWSIEGLGPGSYTVAAEVPLGLFPTTPLQASITVPGTSEVNFGFVSSTAVSLQRFEAEAETTQVILYWQTSHEEQNQGFWIYRQREDSEITKPLTLTPLPSQSQAGASAEYIFVDSNVTPGQRYLYWLETVPGGERFGPLVVTVPLPGGQHYMFLPQIHAGHD